MALPSKLTDMTNSATEGDWTEEDEQFHQLCQARRAALETDEDRLEAAWEAFYDRAAEGGRDDE